MLYVKEALYAYNWFVSLTMAIMGVNNGLTSWTSRAKINPDEYEYKLIKLKSKCENLDFPFNITVKHEESDDPLYFIHIYIDKEHKWQDNYYTNPEVYKFKYNIKGIVPIYAIIVHEDAINFNIDASKFDSIDKMFFHVKLYFKSLFNNIFYDTKEFNSTSDTKDVLADILSTLYLARFTMFDIDKFYEFIKDSVSKATNTKDPRLSFYSNVFDTEERNRIRNKFFEELDVEKAEYTRKTMKEILENITVEGNPQIRQTNNFLRFYTDFLNYIEYMEVYKEVKLIELIGPDPIPV